jgi:diguanylate cyclase (GGDEF)-like protein
MKFDNLPSVTISLGIATFPHDGMDPEDLIRKADAAMYAAKRAGRDRVVKYTRNVKMPLDSYSTGVEN